MRFPQLTLYDFLADFLPGAVALGLFTGLLSLTGTTGPTLSANTGVLLAVASYPVGRTVHALAGQTEIESMRQGTFDKYVFKLESARENADLIDSDIAIESEPAVVARFESVESGDVRFNEWIDKEVVNIFTASDSESGETNDTDGIAASSAIRATDAIDWDQASYGQLQRFGFSELFDASTLYQRYNILETFYRNLWLVSVYFSLLFSMVALAYVFSMFPAAMALGSVLCAAGYLCYVQSLRFLSGWYALSGILVSLFAFIFPALLLSRQGAQPESTHPVFFAGVAIALLVLAFLFALRRLQFKSRQVRAFINELYRQQQGGGE